MSVLLRGLLLNLALCLAAGAAWIETTPGGSTGVRLLSGGQAPRLLCEVAGFEARPLRIGGRDYHQLRVPDAAVTLQAGAPELPVLAASLIIPDLGSMSLVLVAEEHVELALDVAPSKGNLTREVDPATVPWTLGPLYGNAAQAAAWPAEPALLREPYILRDHRGQTVVFQPFQVRPGGRLRVYTRLEVELRPVADAAPNPLVRQLPPRVVDPSFAAVYARHFLNAGDAERYQPLEEQGRLLIICADALLGELAPFVEWKRQQGMEVDLRAKSQVGATAGAILAFVEDYYVAPGLAALLLVGDAEQVPSPSAAGGSSDPSYAMLAGNDFYPDILVGRFSGSTAAQIATQVERSVEYERDPEAGADWYHLGTGIGSAEGAGIGDDGEADWEHQDGLRADLLAYTYSAVDQIYDPGASAVTLSAALNQGRSILNYTGHGSVSAWGTTGFSSSHVGALTNENRLPFIIDVACVNGQFAGGTCFAEVWMRATRNGNPTGAVGIYASTINQSWAPPMAAQDECVDLLTAESALSFGGICYNGAMRMNDEYADYAMTRTWTLFGDPTLQVRTATPLPLTLAHEAVLFSSQASFAVGTGVPGARAALYAEGIIYGAATADAAGLVEIPLWQAPEPGRVLTLTVTAHNHLTHQAPVTVLAEALGAVADLDIRYVGNGQALLQWAPASGAQTYRIWQAEGPAGPWIPLGVTEELSWQAACADLSSSWFRVTALHP